MAGSCRLAEEGASTRIALNELDRKWWGVLREYEKIGHEVSYVNAMDIEWKREWVIFSPPYYPRTDRRKLAAHNDNKRGSVVGYRTGYGCAVDNFIGDPAGVNGIVIYRNQMRKIYKHMRAVASCMILVTKNWTRLGTELRLDLDTILTAEEAGWECVGRHGWIPPGSHWAKFNRSRNTGVEVEDILIFERAL